tara:strand:+ start:165 stop:338 length:174 start_codon:yes stop_codon:yes gene_type:complete
MINIFHFFKNLKNGKFKILFLLVFYLFIISFFIFWINIRRFRIVVKFIYPKTEGKFG